MESGQYVVYAAYALVFLATFLLSRMLMQEQESRAAQENLDDRNKQSSNPLVRLTRPFFGQYVVPMVRGKPYWDNRRTIIRRRLISAGLKDDLNADEFLAFKLFLIVLFPMIGGLLSALDIVSLAWYTILGTGILGWFYPDLWVRSRIQKRQKDILRTLPFVVDLLALSTEAGLDFVGSIGKVVEKSMPSPLIEELEQLLKEIKIGSSRAAAMREMATRVDMPEVNSFIAILISADQMGASIGKVLRQQSEQIRAERFVRAEKAGAKAPTKLIIVTVVFILPAVILLIGTPFIITFMASGGP